VPLPEPPSLDSLVIPEVDSLVIPDSVPRDTTGVIDTTG
jgi:hypothetical protein